ncbi:uncharacterized protein LOC126846455 [Adelges cooleyi]|uniref:uncharacterized protein LOC126846455 n=1 Tax=Adelges cooleyi TaxID=133065 RepID=UPI00218065BC|nr:uncharacterized protein LOC126846455 [Adelges cooleyi]
MNIWYCTFKLDDEKTLEVSRRERDRVLALMSRLWTVTQRSYTNSYDTLYPIIRSVITNQPLDRSKEAELRYFKMNGWTEYQAAHDGFEYKEVKRFLETGKRL